MSTLISIPQNVQVPPAKRRLKRRRVRPQAILVELVRTARELNPPPAPVIRPTTSTQTPFAYD